MKSPADWIDIHCNFEQKTSGNPGSANTIPRGIFLFLMLFQEPFAAQ
ncbi:MAG: hypothetical protein Q8K61_10145 [Gallionella sp.]|jgi:hypothetical protein|nr:hypothetical protein [Gallionella sp.]